MYIRFDRLMDLLGEVMGGKERLMPVTSTFPPIVGIIVPTWARFKALDATLKVSGEVNVSVDTEYSLDTSGEKAVVSLSVSGNCPDWIAVYPNLGKAIIKPVRGVAGEMGFGRVSRPCELVIRSPIFLKMKTSRAFESEILIDDVIFRFEDIFFVDLAEFVYHALGDEIDRLSEKYEAEDEEEEDREGFKSVYRALDDHLPEQPRDDDEEYLDDMEEEYGY